MSNDRVEAGDGADDLLGRWLAHHDTPPADDSAPAPRRVPTAARPSTAAVAQTRPSASAVLADLREAPTVDLHDGLGPVAPPSAFGVRRGLPGSASSGETAELDRPSPVGFEPVILRSVRKKSEPQEGPEEKRSRLSRLRSRVAGPTDHSEPPATPGAPATAPVVSLYADPAPFVPPPVFRNPPPAPAESLPFTEPEALRQSEALRVPEVVLDPEPVLPGPEATPVPVVPEPEPEPAPEPEPEPDPEPEPEPDPEPVLPGPDTEPEPVVPQPEPEPVLPGPDSEPAPVFPPPEPEPVPEPVLPGPDTPPSPLSVLTEHQDDGQEPDVPTLADPAAPTKRRLVARTTTTGTTPAVTPETTERKPRPLVRRSKTSRAPSNAGGTAGAARGLLAAARAATPPPAAPPTVRAVPPPVAKVPLLPVEKPVEALPSPPPMQMPAVYEFAPRKSARRFLSVMLLIGLAVAGYLGYAAYQSRDTVTIGLAGIFTVAALVIWAIRAGATVSRLTLRNGQLEIKRQGGRVVFDLVSTYTDIEVVGKPGSKKWKAVFRRPSMAPVVVDSSMVDGKDFMRVLTFFRPELAR